VADAAGGSGFVVVAFNFRRRRDAARQSDDAVWMLGAIERRNRRSRAVHVCPQSRAV
jgi:hypothetical protein